MCARYGSCVKWCLKRYLYTLESPFRAKDPPGLRKARLVQQRPRACCVGMTLVRLPTAKKSAQNGGNELETCAPVPKPQ